MTSNDTMDFVRQEIENLKKLGESWNMEKYQIEEAIMKAIADKNGNVPGPVERDLSTRPKQSERGRCKTGLALCGYLTIGIILANVVGACLYVNYSPFEVYVNRVVGELNYPVMRRWRLMLLPFHHYLDMENLSIRECLVNNPWYLPEETDCSACEEATEVPRLDNVTDFHNVHAAWGNPIIVTDVEPYVAKEYTVDEFFSYYQTHKEKIDMDLCEVASLDESIDSIDDYYKLLQKIGPDDSPNIRWKLCYGEGLRTIRKFFPRPYFISTEGALEKFLIIVNSNKELLPLPTGQYGNSWLAQVTGASKMELRPIPECNTTCSSYNVTLYKGEVMYLNLELWEADIVGNPSDEPAISLLSTFA